MQLFPVSVIQVIIKGMSLLIIFVIQPMCAWFLEIIFVCVGVRVCVCVCGFVRACVWQAISNKILPDV